MIRNLLVCTGMFLSAQARGDSELPPRVILSEDLQAKAKAGTTVVQQDDSAGIQLTAAVFVHAEADAIMKAINVDQIILFPSFSQFY